jgi:hypothetical protein
MEAIVVAVAAAASATRLWGLGESKNCFFFVVVVVVEIDMICDYVVTKMIVL